VSEPFHVEVSGVAAEQIRVAEAWWRRNRPKAPNAIREELERAPRSLPHSPTSVRALGMSNWLAFGKSICHEFDIIFTTA
jgi:hypothetical protein